MPVHGYARAGQEKGALQEACVVIDVAEGKATVSGLGSRSRGWGGKAQAPLQALCGDSNTSPVSLLYHSVQVMERLQQPLVRAPLLQGHPFLEQLGQSEYCAVNRFTWGFVRRRGECRCED